MKRFTPLIAFVALALALALALFNNPKHEILLLSGGETHSDLPPLTLATRDGAERQFAINGKVTWISFFASWCTSCVEDHHELIELVRTYPQLSLEGIVWNDTPSRIDDWLAQHRNPFTHVWFDTKGKAAMALGVRGLPENFLIDKHGVVRYRIPGPLTPELRKQTIEPLIDKLMGER